MNEKEWEEINAKFEMVQWLESTGQLRKIPYSDWSAEQKKVFNATGVIPGQDEMPMGPIDINPFSYEQQELLKKLGVFK